MPGENRLHSEITETCGCFAARRDQLARERHLGMDNRFAEVSLWVCTKCGQQWLEYFYEMEAFTASGRWYLGAVTADQAAVLTAQNAREMLAVLDWYFYGGSFYGGRSGKTSGTLLLNP